MVDAEQILIGIESILEKGMDKRNSGQAAAMKTRISPEQQDAILALRPAITKASIRKELRNTGTSVEDCESFLQMLERGIFVGFKMSQDIGRMEEEFEKICIAAGKLNARADAKGAAPIVDSEQLAMLLWGCMQSPDELGNR